MTLAGHLEGRGYRLISSVSELTAAGSLTTSVTFDCQKRYGLLMKCVVAALRKREIEY